jgi:hypothetical protein
MKPIIGALTLALALPAAAQAQAPSKQGGSAQLRADMRKLWEDHVTWTRVYIISVANGTADKDATAQRLLQNQVDIGNAISPSTASRRGASSPRC